MTQDLTGHICIPIRAEVYNEFILRMGKSIDNVPDWIENIVLDYLDRTHDDGPWCDEYFERLGLETNLMVMHRKEFGLPEQGYQWQNLLLRNGTEIRMEYRGKYKFASIKHGRLMYKDEAMTPSEFASIVANNTSRNAWRDLELKFPDASDFQLASVARREARATP
ncbi:MAG: hypothetical protein ACRD4Q_09880 [Candidatus Acidiferrales bacterium]